MASCHGWKGANGAVHARVAWRIKKRAWMNISIVASSQPSSGRAFWESRDLTSLLRLRDGSDVQTWRLDTKMHSSAHALLFDQWVCDIAAP